MMLQWMGGSRRKVTTVVIQWPAEELLSPCIKFICLNFPKDHQSCSFSQSLGSRSSRKSTYKRQKQYFEQRKRQLQLQPAGFESYSDGKSSCTLQCGNNRSLDILSLENISSLAYKQKISCINARDGSELNDLSLNRQDTHPSLAILTNEAIALDRSEKNEERTPSSYTTEDAYSEKVSGHLPDFNEDIAGNHDKFDSFKLSPMHQMSVIDLLGDDGGANNDEEENSLHAKETHVAFSVEGLGRVEMETPVHSPKMPGRYFSNCSTPPKKARRQLITAKNMDYDFHDLGSEVDIDFLPYDSSIDQPFCSREMMNIAGSPNQKFKSFRRPSTYNHNGSDLPGVFSNDEPICNIRGSGRNIRNGPSFLDNSIDDLREYDAFCKNQVHQRVIGFDDDFHCKDPWKQDLNFDDWDLHMKRSSTRRTETSNMKESPVPYPKHQIADFPSVVFSDKMWCFDIGIDNGKDCINHFVREGTTESLSLPSEESCSSTAVRLDATKKS